MRSEARKGYTHRTGREKVKQKTTPGGACPSLWVNADSRKKLTRKKNAKRLKDEWGGGKAGMLTIVQNY